MQYYYNTNVRSKLLAVPIFLLNTKYISKFFVFSYLNRHVVDKLEVVNKKWVRVNLQPGSSIDGSVRLNLTLYYIMLY